MTAKGFLLVVLVMCTLWVGTSSYTSVQSDEDMHLVSIENLTDLYLQAIGRGIDIKLPEEQICESIASQIPSIEWQKKSILAMSDRTLVPEDELGELNRYQSYSYETINNALRSYGAKPKLNPVIERMPEIG